MTTIWVFVVGAVAFTVATIFGPWARRSAISRRLRSGSLALADHTSVTVFGTIRETTDLVEAPLSARKCVVVHAHAELPEIDRTAEGEYVVLTTRLMVPFELDTPAGVVLVDATHADVDIKPQRVPSRDAERERAFVVAHRRGAEVARVATFREVVLAPGMRIAVHGVALIEDIEHGERGYRDAAPTRTRIVAHADYPLAIGHAPKSYERSR
jgi:hypothetical protein